MVAGVSEVTAGGLEGGSTGIQAVVCKSVNNSKRGGKSMPSFVSRASMVLNNLNSLLSHLKDPYIHHSPSSQKRIVFPGWGVPS